MSYRVWLVEDDEESRKVFKEELSELADCECESFETMFDANESGRVPDCLILDVAAISAITPGMGTSLENCLGPLRQFLDAHHGVLVGVFSMLDSYAKGTVEEIREHHPDVAIHWLKLPNDLNIFRSVREFVETYRPPRKAEAVKKKIPGGYNDPKAKGNNLKKYANGKGMPCLGGFPGKCDKTAGTVWSPYWCFDCNVKRIDGISENLEEIVGSLEKKALTQRSDDVKSTNS